MSVIVDGLTTQTVLSVTVEHKDANEVFRRFVKADGTRAGAGERALGVSRIRSETSGDLLPVDVSGVILVEAGAAIAADARVTPDADGRAVTRAEPAVKRLVVDGAAANTNIAVAGIAVGDELLDVLALDGTEVTVPTIHAAGQIRSTANLTAKKLLVIWRAPPGEDAGRALLAASAAGKFIPVLLGG